VKLLAELPTEDVEETHHRPVAAILGGIAVLVIMLGVGVTLLIGSGSSDEGDPTALDLSTENVELTDWTTWAADACENVAREHQALTETSTADPVDVDFGVRALADALRELQLPTAHDERAQALSIITAGELAEQAWGGVNAPTRAEAAEGELARADNATQDFVDQLVAIGATCVR
jgi:hypothetical protein